MVAMLMVSVSVLCGPAESGLQRFERDQKWGFRDAAGNVIVEPQYDRVGAFSCGLAPVNLGATKSRRGRVPMGGKWGYVDARGNVVVPITLDFVGGFSEGLAWVSDERGHRYIDATGLVVIDLGSVGSPQGFREGVAPVTEASPDGESTRYIDRQGKTVFGIEGVGDEFHEGLACFSPRPKNPIGDRSYGYIDHWGKIVIQPRFPRANDFQEGLAAVCVADDAEDGRIWRYIEPSGKFAIKPSFAYAESFQNGVARVYRGGRWIEAYDAPWWERLVDGEWQLIDRKGNALRRSKQPLNYTDAFAPSEPRTPDAKRSGPSKGVGSL